MEENQIIFKLILTILFGAIIGLESETREIDNKGILKAKKEESSRIGGIRTYTILSLIGGISGILFEQKMEVFSYLIFLAVGILIAIAYVENIRLKQAFGLTTELAILITFFLGFITTSSLFNIIVPVFILIILTFFLSQKRGIGQFVEKINHREVIDMVKFGILAAVILPLMPNQTITISDLLSFFEIPITSVSQDIANFSLINPFRVWLIVVIISGINISAYITSKFIGSKRSIIITAIIGGIISSTSTLLAFASDSKQKNSKHSNMMLAGATVVSNSMSFFSSLLLLLVISLPLFESLLVPFLFMAALGIIYGLSLILLSRSNVDSDLEVKYVPFSVRPALKFVSIIITVTIIVQLLQLFTTDSLMSIGTSLAGVSGLDGATLALSELLEKQEMTILLATNTLLLTNIVNLLAKCGYSLYAGSRQYAIYTMSGLGLILLGTFIYFLI